MVHCFQRSGWRTPVSFALFCAGLLGAIAIPTTPAQAVPVTQCNEAGLRAAIANTPDGGTITFNCPANSTIPLSNELQLNKALKFDGANSRNLSLDGRDRTRIFRTTKNLTLENLTLTNGRVSNRQNNMSCEGGAVHITFGTLTVDNVTFENNSGVRGGAVCGNYKATLNLKNSTFRGNTAAQGGAILTNTSDLRLTGSTLVDNRTRRGNGLDGSGGALYTYSTLNKRNPILIQDSRFAGNQAEHEGGAAFLSQGNGVNVMVRNSTFINNEALLNPSTGIGSGGAIRFAHAGGQSTASLTNVVFANNGADQEGGAVWAGGRNANLNLNLDRVTFVGNAAGRVPDPRKNETAGGAMVLSTGLNSRVVINATTFSQNTAGNETSGAIYVASDFDGGNVRHRNVIVRNSIFDRNCSQKDIAGTPTVENCTHLVHVRTMQRSRNNQFTAAPLGGDASVYEWAANVHAPSGTRYPITAQSRVQDVKVRPYRDTGDAAPDHPCSDVNAGSGGRCR
jgi:predicted outer membrane repeat protein